MALEDLVRAGKVRYLGVSDTPAWKFVEANVTAHFAAGRPLSGCRSSIRCSSAASAGTRADGPGARTRDRAVVAAQERCAQRQVPRGATVGQVKADRGPFLETFLNQKTFAVVDALESIARAHDGTVARVALAWVQAQPGVSSTIIGARRLAQLEDNVQSDRCEADGRGTRIASTRSRSPRSGSRKTPAAHFSQHRQRRNHGERCLRPGNRLRD